MHPTIESHFHRRIAEQKLIHHQRNKNCLSTYFSTINDDEAFQRPREFNLHTENSQCFSAVHDNYKQLSGEFMSEILSFVVMCMNAMCSIMMNVSK